MSRFSKKNGNKKLIYIIIAVTISLLIIILILDFIKGEDTRFEKRSRDSIYKTLNIIWVLQQEYFKKNNRYSNDIEEMLESGKIVYNDRFIIQGIDNITIYFDKKIYLLGKYGPKEYYEIKNILPKKIFPYINNNEFLIIAAADLNSDGKYIIISVNDKREFNLYGKD